MKTCSYYYFLYRKKLVNNKQYFYYILPAFIFVLLVTIIPIIGTISLSTFSYSIAQPDKTHFTGLNNYFILFRDPRFLNSCRVMLLLILIPVAIQMILGFMLALALNEKLIGTNWMRLFFLCPAVIPPIVIGLIWKLFLIPGAGGLSYFLMKIGLKGPDLLSQPSTALIAIIIAAVWTGTPLVTLMLLSGIETISSSYYEAAAIDGASWAQRHRIITLPLVLQVSKTVIIFRILEALAIFPVIFVLTGGGPAGATEPINYYAYVTGFSYFKFDYAATIIVVFFLLLMLLSFPFLKSVIDTKKGEV